MTNEGMLVIGSLAFWSFCFLRGLAEFFAGFGPGRFLPLANRFPGSGHQRNAAVTFSFASVRTSFTAAASLSFAIVLAAAIVGQCGAVALAAAVVFAARSLPLAVVQSAAEVLFRSGLAWRCRSFVPFWLIAAPSQAPRDQAADGGGRELIKLAAVPRLLRHVGTCSSEYDWKPGAFARTPSACFADVSRFHD
jgi:hypothetical protein